MDDSPDRGYSRAPELRDLVALCRSLNRENVRYILIGGFAVVLHGSVRTTKDIDLLVEASVVNVRALKRAMKDLPDNAVAEVADGDIGRYRVVRVADEVVVDLMAEACGIDYAKALGLGIETKRIEDVDVPVAGKRLLILTKNTVRDSDKADVAFLRLRIAAEEP